MTDEIPKQYWTIGDVAEILEVAESCVRFWDDEFKVSTIRTRQGNRLAGHRRFVLGDIVKMQTIQYLLQVERYTIEGCRGKMERLKWPLPATRWKDELRHQLSKLILV